MKRVYRRETFNDIEVGYIKSGWLKSSRAKQLGLAGRLIPAVGSCVDSLELPASMDAVLKRVPLQHAITPLATMTREIKDLLRVGLNLKDFDIVNCQFAIEARFVCCVLFVVF